MKGRKSVVRRRKRLSSVLFFSTFFFVCVWVSICVANIGGCLDMPQPLSSAAPSTTTRQISYDRIWFFFQLHERILTDTLLFTAPVAKSAGANAHIDRVNGERRECQAKDGLWTCAMVVFHFTSSEFPLVYYVHVVCARSFLFFFF